MESNKALSDKALVELFEKSLLIDFKRFSSKNPRLQPLVIKGKNVVVEFKAQKRKRYGITKENLDWSYIEIEVARKLVTLHLFHMREKIAIKFESTNIVRVALYVRP